MSPACALEVMVLQGILPARLVDVFQPPGYAQPANEPCKNTGIGVGGTILSALRTVSSEVSYAVYPLLPCLQ